MTPLELRRLLHGASVDDVLLSGFVDKGEQPLRFYPSLRSYYFELGGTLLSFSTIGYSGRGLVNIVESISSDLDLDDDMDFAVSSIKQMLLKDPDGTNRISKMILWDCQQRASDIECSAIRVDLANDQIIFLDPSYHFGIRVGGVEQQGIWAENALQGYHSLTELDLSEG